MAVAETRVGQKGILEATEVMTRLEMLKAYTINAAKVMMNGEIDRIN
jgi:imidazolonepropionase-like amidohydrolase